MSISKEERLSALLDGEVTRFERRRLTALLIEDHAARERWERAHLIRDALRGELPERRARDFLDRVNAGIDAMEGGDANRRFPLLRAGWWRPVAGVAVAASVAVATVLGLQSLVGPGDRGPVVDTASTMPVRPVQGGFRLASSPAPGVVQPGISDDEVRKRISQYLINHSEYATRPGMLPYARIVGYRVRGVAAE